MMQRTKILTAHGTPGLSRIETLVLRGISYELPLEQIDAALGLPKGGASVQAGHAIEKLHLLAAAESSNKESKV